MFVNIRVTFLSRGQLVRGIVHTRLRHLENARPWLEIHYPYIRFHWSGCIAFYQ